MLYAMTRISLFLAVMILLFAGGVSVKECTDSDFEYKYTECDSKGQRWRVAVPKSCQQGNVPFPQRGMNCSFSCSGGKFLDMKSQQCTLCQEGTYSLGGGIRFEDFDKLPDGFQVRSSRINSDDDMTTAANGVGSAEETTCPANVGWLVRDGWLVYLPTPCSSSFSYSARLVRSGFVDYFYRMPKGVSNRLLFSIDVRNEQCQSTYDRLKSWFGSRDKGSESTRHSGTGQWQRNRVQLKSGQNVITWSVTNGIYSESGGGGVSTSIDPIIVASIDIYGIAFADQCTVCPAGTFSSAGSQMCTPCKADEYSMRGAAKCVPCSADRYSEPRSSKCKLRPACQDVDYYKMHSSCVDGKTHEKYKWVLPKICREDLSNSVRLPITDNVVPCPKCNPGMSLTSAGKCEFCPANEFSDGSFTCARCPPNTVPNYGYQYSWWYSLPPNMQTNCEVVADKETSLGSCNDGNSWLVAGDRLHTSHSRRPGVVLELQLTVAKGFSNPLMTGQPSQQNPIGHLTFVFETKCERQDCAFYFAEKSKSELVAAILINEWNGSVSRQVYTHPITSRHPTTFIWAFVRSGGSLSNAVYLSDQATIFSVNLTNAVDGGASSCLPCPIQQSTSSKPQCVPCQPGHYMDASSHQCVRCPIDTMLNTSGDRVGSAASCCLPCGLNLHSTDGVDCITDGILKIDLGKNQTRRYNITKLGSNLLQVTGVKMFGHEGTSYYHVFNISLFNVKKPARCYAAYPSKSFSPNEDMEDVAIGFVCRSTAVPLRDHNGTSKLFYVTPMDLGTRLVGITTDSTLDGITLDKKLLDTEKNHLSQDVHFFYRSLAPATENCPRGQTVIVSLRCDVGQNKTIGKLPRECPDGTCDGCTYHILLLSADACPLCTKSDYQTIRGECVMGTQEIHYIPAKHCVLSGRDRPSTSAVCTTFGVQARIAVFVIGVLTVVLCVLICWVWKKNKRLEYKYMKLVEAKAGRDGQELPAAESCALEEGEDDEEEKVIFKKISKKSAKSTIADELSSPTAEKRGGLFGAGRSKRRYRDVDVAENQAFAFDDEENDVEDA